MDTDTMVALIGFLGLVVTTIGGVYVATKTNQSEKEDTAEATLDKTKIDAYEDRLAAKDDEIEAKNAEIRARAGQIALRDDRILDLQEDLTELDIKLAKVEREKAIQEVRCRSRIAELEDENDQLGVENRRLRGEGLQRDH